MKYALSAWSIEPLDHGQREVGRAAAVRIEIDHREHRSARRSESRAVAATGRDAVARHPHIQVSRVDDARRPAGLVRDQGRQERRVSGLRLLTAERRRPSACRCRRPCSGATPRQWATTAWISLGFWVDEWMVIWPSSPGNGEGRLRLQVEMLLAAGAKRPLDHVFGPLQRGRRRRPAPGRRFGPIK